MEREEDEDDDEVVRKEEGNGAESVVCLDILLSEDGIIDSSPTGRGDQDLE